LRFAIAMGIFPSVFRDVVGFLEFIAQAVEEMKVLYSLPIMVFVAIKIDD